MNAASAATLAAAPAATPDRPRVAVPSPEAPPADRPEQADRQHVLDRLRGFALLGVLLVNTPFLMTGIDGMTDRSMPGLVDRAAALVTEVLFQAKSYVVFSFLFGYSLSILLERVAARGRSQTRVYAQRLGALLVIGLAHALLLFVGDILVLYAVLGTSLLVLRRRSDRTLLTVAGLLLALQTVLLVGLLFLPGGGEIDGQQSARIDDAWRTGGLIEATWMRIQVWPFAFGLIFLLQGLLVAALFCVGLVCGRRHLLANPEAIRPQLLRIRRWGFAVGLPLQLVAGVIGVWAGDSETQQLLSLAIMYPTAPILSAAYIATVALLPRRGFAKLVESDGKMSLTIYLAESLVMTTLAAGWGLGWYGQRTGVAFGIAVAVWLGLLVFAAWWTPRHGVGPAERLLRRMTYAGSR